MIVPCKQQQLCEDLPLSNISAEAPDSQIFVGVYFPPVQPPLQQSWVAESCAGRCISYISQEDANICAFNQAQTCVVNPPPVNPPEPPPVCTEPNGCVLEPPPVLPPPTPPPVVPPPVGPPVLPCNVPQTCCALCPDGTTFCFTVEACKFRGATLEIANQLAYDFACQQALLKRVCLSGPLNGICINTAYNGAITASGQVPFTFDIVSGSLPPGMSFDQGGGGSQAFITGAATVSGNYTFVVRATDGNLNFMEKTFIIRVLEITSGNMPNGTVNQPYNHTFTSNGGLPPITWEIVSGVLPPGLSITPTGIVSGTPTEEGGFQFTIRATDATGVSCEKGQSIVIDAGCVIINESPLPDATVGVSYLPANFPEVEQGYVFMVEGGVAYDHFWHIIDGAIPPGMTFTFLGTLFGTPTAIGTYTFTVDAQDPLDLTVVCQKEFTITVHCNGHPTVSELVWGGGGFGGSALDQGFEVNVAGGDGFMHSWASANPHAKPFNVPCVPRFGGGCIGYDEPCGFGSMTTVAGTTLCNDTTSAYDVQITVGWSGTHRDAPQGGLPLDCHTARLARCIILTDNIQRVLRQVGDNGLATQSFNVGLSWTQSLPPGSSMAITIRTEIVQMEGTAVIQVRPLVPPVPPP